MGKTNSVHDKGPKLLLYFGHAPMEGAGSAIIVFRHLRRLAAKGWKVVGKAEKFLVGRRAGSAARGVLEQDQRARIAVRSLLDAIDSTVSKFRQQLRQDKKSTR